MAVPFNMPDDQNEVEVIITQLQTLLNRLQVVVRRNQENSPSTPSTATTRARNPSGFRVRNPEQASTGSAAQSTLPDLLNHLTRLASPQEASSVQLTAMPTIRSPIRRTNSESSCCEETKISTVNHGYVQDWNHVGVSLRKIADDFTPSIVTQVDGVDEEQRKIFSADHLLSKLVPGTVSSCSLWTAMICFVGWHIFRAR